MDNNQHTPQDAAQQQAGSPALAGQAPASSYVPAGALAQAPSGTAISTSNSNVVKSSAVDYFANTFASDLAEFAAFKNRKTGYANMDAVQPLYPGFYVVGAISSLGKTTFIHQMADQIATDGIPVLYFSLEQSKFEMYSKSISRRIYQESQTDPSYRTFSSMEIRSGVANGTRELTEQINAYVQQVKSNLWIYECNFDITVEEIKQHIDDFIKDYHVIPTVVVDYLQIISPSVVNDRRLEGKASIDHIVHTLKAIQSTNKLTLIAICSLNRQNYMTSIDFESFKESGGIEYTADVVWGLQLEAIHDEIFQKEGKVNEKREAIKNAKNAIPRSIELVILKNRYGRASYSVGFDYNPIYDTFTPYVFNPAGVTDTDDSGWMPSTGANPFANS